MRAGVGPPSAADYGQGQPFGLPKDHRRSPDARRFNGRSLRQRMPAGTWYLIRRVRCSQTPSQATGVEKERCPEKRAKLRSWNRPPAIRSRTPVTDRSAAESPIGHQNPVHAHDGARRDPPPGSVPSPERPSFCWPTTWIGGRSSRATVIALPYKTRPSGYGCQARPGSCSKS